MTLLTLQIASLPDRDNIVAEIWCGNDQVAEVSNESSGGVVVEIFPVPDGGAWSFYLDDLEAIFIQARANLRKK